MLRLFNHRYGPELPDDDAGLAEIWLLIQNTSLALHEPEKKMRHIIEARAPWLPKDKAEERMEFAMKLTRQERSPSSVELGECMRVTAGEWVALRVTQFTPMDITADELRAMRKTIRNARRRERARAKHISPRADYLASLRQAEAVGGRRHFSCRVLPEA